MEPFAALDSARSQFERRLSTVGNVDWSKPTPCGGWTVRELVVHLVVGNSMSVDLLAGKSKDDTVAAMERHRSELEGAELGPAFAESADAQASAFRQPGALERVVHHPAMDMPSTQLLGFRTGDLTLHSWDLAHATGGDESLPPGLVENVWSLLEPMASFIGQTGVFGEGPSGKVGADAPLERRLLDLSGRRP